MRRTGVQVMDNKSQTGDLFAGMFVLGDRPAELESAENAILDQLQLRGFEKSSLFAVRLAIQEAVSNAFKHGNRNDPDKTVTISARMSANAVTIEVQDEGPGFELEAVPDPTAEENLEIPSGRGIVLMRAFMTSVEYVPPGNILRMTLDRTSDDASASA